MEEPREGPQVLVVHVSKNCSRGEFKSSLDQLDPSWLSLKAANNLAILVDGDTYVRIQIEDQVGE